MKAFMTGFTVICILFSIHAGIADMRFWALFWTFASGLSAGLLMTEKD